MNISKKKLFICITKSNWGGAQKYVFDIATNTPRDQFDTTVILGGNGDLKKKLEEAGVKTILLNNSQRDVNLMKDLNLFFELIILFNKEKPDVVHLNSSKMGIVGALAIFILNLYFKLTAKNHKIKTVFTALGWAFNEDRSLISKTVIKMLSVFTVMLCNKAISVSKTTKKQIGEPFSKKFVVIKLGLREIELISKDSARENLSEKMRQINPRITVSLSKNPIWVGTISELHTTKGLSYAIEAISKIKSNVIFVIIGEGEKRKELEELIVKLGIANKVCLLGHTDRASTYLKAFDIFTLSSITEALPYVLLEAGYASLSVVTSNVGGIPEIVENNKTGILVSPRNSEEIKNSIEYLIKNPQKSKVFGDSLKEKVTKDFTQKKMLEKTFSLYKK